MGYPEFKSDFIYFYSKFENTKNKIPLIKRALDKAVNEELHLRDNQRTFQVRDITNSEKLLINYYSRNLMCKYSKEKNCIYVGTLGPIWDTGWRDISKDKFVSEQIRVFFIMQINSYIGGIK